MALAMAARAADLQAKNKEEKITENVQPKDITMNSAIVAGKSPQMEMLKA